MKSYEVQTITISFYDFGGETIFVSDEIRAKRPQKPTLNQRKFEFWEKMEYIPN